ncbi:triacylglycerol lipase [Schizosaccharomyces japonicus yFS275]|uniref:Triacylglycerol lipase n=1 Tax=Schizosaccharomyces japonicus (strain yFS275 / FY16936) TaxID=402676 RepID=B6K2M0_SCHJY|nr:triacylglycerol lipase [Schizosaccharomyces japonicus yFS275]EEB07401.1 triacylglycerol lipase [Schizosaccharomyces japonicus yFS275]
MLQRNSDSRGYVYGTISTIWLLLVSLFEWLLSSLNALRHDNNGTVKRKRLAASDCTSWQDWKETALSLDKRTNNFRWRYYTASAEYDYKLIQRRLECLKRYRSEKNDRAIMCTLRSGFIRNLGNLGDPSLFTRTYYGTKILIEDYVHETCKCLHSVRMSKEIPRIEKLEFFFAAKLSIGRTCLFFNGGTAYGLYHFGIAKALWERGLLPRVIAGSASGALIAALLGVYTKEEYPRMFSEFSSNLWETCKYTVGFSLSKLLRYGNMLDISIILKTVRKCTGNMTFQEAYDRTGRVINIVITPFAFSGSPVVLNYLTAPDVLIWSAARTSNSWAPVFRSSKLITKQSDGSLKSCALEEFVGSRPERNAFFSSSAFARISEIFNVNHFVITQSRPSLFPFISDELHHHSYHVYWVKLLRVLSLSLAFRMRQLDLLGFVPSKLRRFVLKDAVLSPHIILTPNFSFSDIVHTFTEPSPDHINYWILVGERTAWQAITLLRVRCKIELAIEKAEDSLFAEGHSPDESICRNEESESVNIKAFSETTSEMN